MVWMVLMGFGRSLDGCLDRGLEAVWRAGWGLEGVWMRVWRGLEGPGRGKNQLWKMSFEIPGWQNCSFSSKKAKIQKNRGSRQGVFLIKRHFLNNF